MTYSTGDGNLHPLILYDANCPGDAEKTTAFGADSRIVHCRRR
jgi:glycolate oxidase